MIKHYGYLGLLILGLACTPKSDNQQLKSDVVHNLTNNVVVPTYEGLYKSAKYLQEQIYQIVTGDQSALENGRDAWVASRRYWEQSEAFLFGPVDYEEIDPALDSWPADVQAINEILNSEATITGELIAQNAEARGFHLIEYLLWGADGTKTAAHFSTREIEYLKAAVNDFVANSQRLYESWASGDTAFANTLLKVGNSHYGTHKDVVAEFLEGVIAIADEVANEKIAGPLNEEGDEPELDEQESYFSDNTKNDLIDNLISIQHIYEGSFGEHTGKGLSALVAEQDAALDTRIKAKIAAAQEVIRQLPDSFNDALYNSRGALLKAKQAVLDLHGLLDKDAKSLLLR